MKKLFITTALGMFFFFIIFVSKIYAVDFIENSSINYKVESDGSMRIREVKEVKNISANFYIPKNTEETFIISAFKTRSKTLNKDLEKVATTIQVKDLSGQDLDSNIQINEKNIEVKVPLQERINRGDTSTVVLEYQNFELAGKSGNVWNFYLPGYAKGFFDDQESSVGSVTRREYDIALELSNSFDEPNFIHPEPTRKTILNSYTKYHFEPSELEGNPLWVQIGSQQYYDFTITQEVDIAKGFGSKIFKTWYDLILPRDASSTNQKVYFDSISPQPQYIKKDGEGNIIARFGFTDQSITEIKVKGTIVTNMTTSLNAAESAFITDINLSKEYFTSNDQIYIFEDLLQEQPYWEVDAPKIQEVASELKSNEKKIYNVLLKDYLFVTETVDYDKLKKGVSNVRQGALTTLEGGSSVCMEYSDLLITLLRAQGIPSRAAFGYGFDHRSAAGTQEKHQWAETYFPNYGWVAVDPTWGDTGRRNYIGGDVDHALWYVAGRGINSPTPVVKNAYMDPGDIDLPEFNIQVTSKKNLEDTQSQKIILEKFPYSKKLKLEEKLDQLNIYGKIIFLGIPVILLILLAISLIITLIKLIRRFSKKA